MKRSTKNILIVSAYFPPCESIGSKRPYKIARFLAKAGWRVAVLTVDSQQAHLESLDFENIGEIEIIRTKAFMPLESLRKLFRAGRLRASEKQASSSDSKKRDIRRSTSAPGIFRKLARKSIVLTNYIDEWSGWRAPALRAIRSTKTDFDVVLSTIPPNSTAVLGRDLAKYFNCSYVLDYRDPWSELVCKKMLQGKTNNEMYSRNLEVEKECLRAADLITTVSPGISRMLSERVQCRVLTIPQGYSGPIKNGAFDKREKFVLYAGSLAYGRNLSFVLTCLKTYAEKNGELIRLAYCGPHGSQAMDQARSAHAEEFLKVKGQRIEGEVAQYACRALCNLVIVSRGYEYSYPGKLFDLLTSGRPIYVCSAAQSEAGKLVVDYDIGTSIVGNNSKKLMARLKFDNTNEFTVPERVSELCVDNAYKRLVDDGLGNL